MGVVCSDNMTRRNYRKSKIFPKNNTHKQSIKSYEEYDFKLEEKDKTKQNNGSSFLTKYNTIPAIKPRIGINIARRYPIITIILSIVSAIFYPP